MKRFHGLVALLAAAALLGCGKKRSERAEVVECSSISLDAKGTAQCLVQLYNWKGPAAQRAAVARHRELDSIKTWREDSLWNLDAAKHGAQLRTCRRGPDQIDGCLLVAGWPLPRVQATAESLWHAAAPAHRKELQACMRRSNMNLSSCLTLYYKWDSERALATADSVARVRLGGRTR